MNHKDLPERWKQKIRVYLISMHITDRSTLRAHDFFINQVARLKFDDGSYAEFRYPLVIEAPELDEIGVFTEHCGYHLFPLAGTHVSVESDI